MIEIFLKGLIVGLIVSAPMGPIGVLCVQKTINKGRFQGFMSGLGAATADTSYAVLAAFGFVLSLVAEVHEGSEIFISCEHHISAFAAVAAVWTTFRNEWLASERNRAVSAFA